MRVEGGGGEGGLRMGVEDRGGLRRKAVRRGIYRKLEVEGGAERRFCKCSYNLHSVGF